MRCFTLFCLILVALMFTRLDCGIIALPTGYAVPLRCPMDDAEAALAFIERYNERWKSCRGGCFDVYYTLGIRTFLREHGLSGRTIDFSDQEIDAAIEADISFGTVRQMDSAG